MLGRLFSGLLLAVVVCGLAAAESQLKLAPPADGADAVPVLRDALAACRAQGVRRLVLEPGVWNLFPDRADGAFRHVSNHDPGYRRLGLHLDGLENFEVDGQGATLLCHGVLIPVAADRMKNFTLRNLVIQWDKPFHLEGTVLAVGPDSFDVEMLPECGVELRNGRLYGGVAEGYFGELADPSQARQDFQWNYWIDPASKAAAALQPKLVHWNPKTKSFPEITQLGPNRFRIRNAHVNTLPAAGSVMVCKGMNRQNRLAPAIHVTSSQNVTVENVIVHHAGGMGLIVEDSTNVTARKFQTSLKPGAKSLVTTTADATHFVGCRGLVRVEECLFENMLDDSCNVHGVYAIAEGLLAPDRLAVSFSHFEQLGTEFVRPGDELQLLKSDTLLGYARCKVKSVVRHNEDYYVLTLEEPIAEVYQPDGSVENLSARPDVIYRNNTVRNNRARGILLTAGGKVLIEDNRFERPSMMGVLIEGDNEFWYESGGVQDVTIRNNTFVGLSNRAPLMKLSPMQPREKRLLPPYHHNIRILGNTIQAASPLVIDANRVKGLEFSDNLVTFAGAPDDPSLPAFKFNACQDVVLRGNKFSRPVRIHVNPEGSSIVLERNENLAK